MKIGVNETVWEMLSEDTQNNLSEKAEIIFEEGEPTECVFCHKEMPKGQQGFCMPCLIKNDPKFWHKYKEGEKKR